MKEKKKISLFLNYILCLMLVCIGCAKETYDKIPIAEETQKSQINVNELSTVDMQYWGPDKKWDNYKDCMGFAYNPDGYQLTAHIQMLDRNLYVIIPVLADDDYDMQSKFQDYAHRIVIEQHWPGIDTTTLTTREETVLEGGIEAIQYIYGNGNYITYAELPPNMPSIQDQYLEPVDGDYVIEWGTEFFDCRIYGSFTHEELGRIAEGWVGFNY